jgi:hypothetical protein
MRVGRVVASLVMAGSLVFSTALLLSAAGCSGSGGGGGSSDEEGQKLLQERMKENKEGKGQIQVPKKKF